MKKLTGVIFGIIGAVSGLITIYGWIQETISGGSVLNPMIIMGIVVFVFCVVCLFLVYNRKFRYFALKYIKHYFAKPNLPYYLCKKEITYTYRSLYEMSYRKKITLTSKVDALTSFKGKFRWSKPMSLNQFKVSCLSPHNKLTLGRDTTWNTYTVEFTPAPKGSQRIIDVLIENLYDPEGETLPFCNASIVEQTDFLRIEVILEGGLKFCSFVNDVRQGKGKEFIG
ncbi:MAG: hypothetical protein LIO95_09710, partial [Clostridiales bacterium]|nr:hypothetical protein [Clostridiales bacterium]